MILQNNEVSRPQLSKLPCDESYFFMGKVESRNGPSLLCDNTQLWAFCRCWIVRNVESCKSLLHPPHILGRMCQRSSVPETLKTDNGYPEEIKRQGKNLTVQNSDPLRNPHQKNYTGRLDLGSASVESGTAEFMIAWTESGHRLAGLARLLTARNSWTFPIEVKSTSVSYNQHT